MSSDDHIIRMANQIAAFFAIKPEAEAIDGTEDHIVQFWPRAMRQQLAQRFEKDGGDGLSPVALQAAERIKARLGGEKEMATTG